MRQIGVCLLICASVSFGQTPVAAPPASTASAPATAAADQNSKHEIEQAEQELRKISELVQAGALPRARMLDAERKVADAQDEAILRRTLYGDLSLEALTEQQADEMVAAAQRRVDRQRQKLEAAKDLVADGVTAQTSLSPFREELEFRQRNLELAKNRARLLKELAIIARSEQAMDPGTSVNPSVRRWKSMERYDGSGIFRTWKDLGGIALEFEKRFFRPLPISAEGETSVHRSLGFDHRGRVDVAVNPDTPEGIWLRRYLESKKIPYYAFRRAIPGKATAAHIHIGPGSLRLHSAD